MRQLIHRNGEKETTPNRFIPRCTGLGFDHDQKQQAVPSGPPSWSSSFLGLSGRGSFLECMNGFVHHNLCHSSHPDNMKEVLWPKELGWLHDTCQYSEKLACCYRIVCERLQEFDLLERKRIHLCRFDGQIIEGLGSGIALLFVMTQGCFKRLSSGESIVEGCREQFGITEGVTDAVSANGIFQIPGVAH